jgi:sugar phosphate permease
MFIRVTCSHGCLGFFSAGLVTLPSTAFANICPDLSLLGTRLGMSWGVSSVATLIGAPIAGALLKTNAGKSDFSGVQIWSGVCLLLGTSCCIVLWISTVKRFKKGWFV